MYNVAKRVVEELWACLSKTATQKSTELLKERLHSFYVEQLIRRPKPENRSQVSWGKILYRYQEALSNVLSNCTPCLRCGSLDLSALAREMSGRLSLCTGLKRLLTAVYLRAHSLHICTRKKRARRLREILKQPTQSFTCCCVALIVSLPALQCIPRLQQASKA